MLVLGLRRGEALGLLWSDVAWQLQRSGRQLYHRQTKTGYSDAALPLPAICIAALKQQAEVQAT
jgi:integrase